jgi:hypothetical protein
MLPCLETHIQARKRGSEHQSTPDEGSNLSHSIELLGKLPDGQGAKMPVISTTWVLASLLGSSLMVVRTYQTETEVMEF